MSNSSLNKERLREALYFEFRQFFAGKEEIINSIKLIDSRLAELGVSDELLINAKLNYFSTIKKFRDQINDQDQLNIYILNILEENKRNEERKTTEDEILNTIVCVLEGRR